MFIPLHLDKFWGRNTFLVHTRTGWSVIKKSCQSCVQTIQSLPQQHLICFRLSVLFPMLSLALFPTIESSSTFWKSSLITLDSFQLSSWCSNNLHMLEYMANFDANLLDLDSGWLFTINANLLDLVDFCYFWLTWITFFLLKLSSTFRGPGILTWSLFRFLLYRSHCRRFLVTSRY